MSSRTMRNETSSFRIWIATAIALSVAALSEWAVAEQAPVNVGSCTTIESQVLHETRRYCVHLPASYGYAGNAKRRYPVLYVLDGEVFFTMAAGVADFMGSGSNGNYAIPDMIVIGVDNTKRTRDMTPTHSLGHTGGIGDFSSSGGGAAFLSYLEKDLVPKIDGDFRTTTFRVLAGHSFAGLATVNAFQDKGATFQNFIAIDPSLWWDDGVMLRQAKASGVSRDIHRRLYIALANTPSIDGAYAGIAATHMASIRAYAQFMKDKPDMASRFRMDYFADEEHGSVPLLALYHGLAYIFDGYKLTFAAGLNDPDNIGKHYEQVSDRLGAPFLPPESLVNGMGYLALMDLKEPAKAIKLFTLNTKWYPASANAYDSLAEAYASTGDNANAARNYAKSVELNPGNENAKAWLKKYATP